jgi:K+-transporting ATPase ATPase C chain
MSLLLASIRIAIASLLICVVGYAGIILGIAQAVTTDTAEASLITTPDGRVIGSRLVAQKFTQPQYFWSRPSAADYNAAAAAGSNKSPTSTDLTERAQGLITQYGATADKPLPADLVAASGAGLDPHISERGARYQAQRVAAARGIELSTVEHLIDERAFAPGGFMTPDRVVNVLELNLALDALKPE